MKSDYLPLVVIGSSIAALILFTHGSPFQLSTFQIDEIDVSISSLPNYHHLFIAFHGTDAPVINIVINEIGYDNEPQNAGIIETDVSDTILHTGVNTCQLRVLDSIGKVLQQSDPRTFII